MLQKIFGEIHRNFKMRPIRVFELLTSGERPPWTQKIEFSTSIAAGRFRQVGVADAQGPGDGGQCQVVKDLCAVPFRRRLFMGFVQRTHIRPKKKHAIDDFPTH